MLTELALPPVARYYACAFAIYGFVSALMTGPGALLPAALGLEVVPPFDQPWLSTSLADYWGRRWVSLQERGGGRVHGGCEHAQQCQAVSAPPAVGGGVCAAAPFAAAAAAHVPRPPRLRTPRTTASI